MRPKRLLLASAAILLASAAPVHAESLTEALRATLQTNPEIRSALENRQASEQLALQASGARLPTVDVTADYGKEASDNTTTRGLSEGTYTLTRGDSAVTITQPLFDGFAAQHDISRAEKTLESSDYAYQRTAEAVGMTAVEAYLEALKQRKLRKLAEENIALHQEILDKVKAKAEGGAGNEADVQQTQSRLALAQATLSAIDGALRIADARYERIVGHPPQDLQEPTLDAEALPKALDQAIKAATTEHPAIVGAGLDVAAAQSNYENALSAFMPTVNLELAYSNNANVSGTRGYAKALSALVKLSYNLYNGGRDEGVRHERANRVNQSREALEVARRSTQEAVVVAWESLAMAQERVALLEKQVQVSQDVVKAYADQFKLGKRTLLDLLNGENELYTAKTSYTSEKFAFMTAHYRLWNSLGVLRDALDAPLPERPAAAKRHTVLETFLRRGLDQLKTLPGKGVEQVKSLGDWGQGVIQGK
ncbi:putative TolC family type I secretion outer membrane protein [Magnetofaba australis IT-1]|uniref:Putative TolC family type I secretion outer membrane protein n=2 Tax=Magnetofaba TaxID=1472292 RepID=A0A1Y2K1E2_9PROT|nr:putative TolC family type I secretion outer membrane protein [Magnetofaba australis IT-1]